MGTPPAGAWQRAFAAVDARMGRAGPPRRRQPAWLSAPAAQVTSPGVSLSGTGTLTAAATIDPAAALAGAGTLTATATA